MNGRGALVLILGAAVLATSGCSLFRSKTGYELSPESRPLEVPPELSAPSSDGALAIPQVGTAQRVASSGAFTLEDSPMGAYGRVGIALDRIDGVNVKERSQLLTVYTVEYDGQTVLVRIAAHGDGARVSVANTEGVEISSGPGAALLVLLQQRLK